MSALEKLLSRLSKWPEGAACQVLEAAIESNWSGFAHEGATRIAQNWAAQQAKAPTPAAADAAPEELNQEVIDQQLAARNLMRQAKIAQYATTE